MDNITRTLISQLLHHKCIPEDHEYTDFHRVIKKLGLDLSKPRVSKVTLDFLLGGEFDYAYIQVLVNSVIPEGAASEFMEEAILYRWGDDHYGHTGRYDLKLLDKKTLLKKKNSEWVWKNRAVLEEIMKDTWEPYLKVQQIIDNINSL